MEQGELSQVLENKVQQFAGTMHYNCDGKFCGGCFCDSFIIYFL